MQTVYKTSNPAAFAGMIGDSTSAIIETYPAGQDIGFGVPVSISDGKAVPGNTDSTPGITIHTHKEQKSADVSTYTQGDAVPVLTFGHVWVQVAGPVTQGEKVQISGNAMFCSETSGLSGAADFKGRNARFVTGAATGGFALVEIR